MTTLNPSNTQRIGQLSSQQPLVNKDGTLTRQGYLLLDALSTQSLVGLTSATSATSGAASGLPATPLGYLEVPLNGVVVKIPYYNP